MSSYYTRQALHFARTQPNRWLKLLAKKFALTWNATEISDTEDQYTYAHWSWPLAPGSIWHLGVLAPLAALGIWITAADWRRLWVLHLMLALYTGSVVLFYVFARYRFPIVPFLVLFAAAGLTGLRAFLRTHQPLRIVACAAAVGSVAVFCNLPMVPRNKLEAATRYNDGVGLEAAGREDDAIREYQAAVQLDPGLAVAHNDLGLAFGKQGRLADAAAELAETVRLAPAFAKAHNNLGVVLGRRGEGAAAEAQFEEAIRLDPDYGEARLNLASLLAQSGRVDKAIAALPHASSLARGDPRLLSRLAGVFAASGRPQEAAKMLRLAIQAVPGDANLHSNLGTVLAQQGDLAGAAVEFERAAALNPHDAQIQRNLARIRGRR